MSTKQQNKVFSLRLGADRERALLVRASQLTIAAGKKITAASLVRKLVDEYLESEAGK
jgi:hypothetical protein